MDTGGNTHNTRSKLSISSTANKGYLHCTFLKPQKIISLTREKMQTLKVKDLNKKA